MSYCINNCWAEYKTEAIHSEKQIEALEEGMKKMDAPKVFISYSWDSEEHKEWVKAFADRLHDDGIDVIIDQRNLALGDRLPQFMEQQISLADFVLIICTPAYKKKADARQGGVGYEGCIISGELFSTQNERKFIPIVRNGNFNDALPVFLSGKLGIDLSETNSYEDNYDRLVTAILGENKKTSFNERSTNTILQTKVPNISPDNKESGQLGNNIADKATISKAVRMRDSDIKQFENICDVLQKTKYWLVEYDMGGPIPQVKLEGLFELCYQEDDPFMEFIDPVLEAVRKKLFKQIKIFYGKFSVYMFPQELPIGDCWVSHMWLSSHGKIPMPDDEKKKTFEQEVEELNTLATNVWEEYKGFVRQFRYYMEKT